MSFQYIRRVAPDKWSVGAISGLSISEIRGSDQWLLRGLAKCFAFMNFYDGPSERTVLRFLLRWSSTFRGLNFAFGPLYSLS